VCENVTTWLILATQNVLEQNCKQNWLSDIRSLVSGEGGQFKAPQITHGFGPWTTLRFPLSPLTTSGSNHDWRCFYFISSYNMDCWARAARITINRRTPLLLAVTDWLRIFTALYGMQTRSSDEKAVRLSVRHTRELWQNGRKICLDIYTIRKSI